MQAIIPTYKFYCDCVNVTSWETYVQPGGINHAINRVYDITFQVYLQPSPTVTSSNGYEGCYILVGENIFTSFTFSVGGFVQLSPTPLSIITAQSGDVVGYYTNSRDGDNQGIQLERDNDYNENIVWYKMEMDSLRTNNKLSIGSGGALTVSTRAAPMLKVGTSEFNLIITVILENGAYIFYNKNRQSIELACASSHMCFLTYFYLAYICYSTLLY